MGDKLIQMIDSQSMAADPLCEMTQALREQAYQLAVTFGAGPEFHAFEKADYELFRLKMQLENHDLTLAMRCTNPEDVRASRAGLMMQIRSAIVYLAMTREALRHQINKGDKQ